MEGETEKPDKIQKDIKKYVLPSRRKIDILETEDKEQYIFELYRPTMAERNKIMEKYGLFNKKAIEDQTVLKTEENIRNFNKDSIRLVCRTVTRKYKEGETEKTEVIDIHKLPDGPKGKDELDNMDVILFEYLLKLINSMMGASVKDSYFRSKGD